MRRSTSPAERQSEPEVRVAMARPTIRIVSADPKVSSEPRSGGVDPAGRKPAGVARDSALPAPAA
jgi:hypothetical protein